MQPPLDDDLLASALAALEAEAQRLEACRRERAPIVQRIEERKRLVRERDEFELSAADPKRFGRRGYNAVTEDQQRRRFYVALPRLEAALRTRLRAWTAEHGPFLYDGVDYLAALERDHADAQAQAQQKQGPSGGATAAATATPVSAATAAGKASSRRKRTALKKRIAVSPQMQRQTQAQARAQTQDTAGAKKRNPPGATNSAEGKKAVANANATKTATPRTAGGDRTPLGETQRRRVRRPREGAERSGGARMTPLARRVVAQHRLNRRLSRSHLSLCFPFVSFLTIVAVICCCTGLSKRTLNKAFF